MAQLYVPGEEVRLEQGGAGGSSQAGQALSGAVGFNPTFQGWDPSQETGYVTLGDGRQVKASEYYTGPEWTDQNAATSERIRLHQKERAEDNARNKRNFMLAVAALGGVSALTSAGAIGGGAAAGSQGLASGAAQGAVTGGVGGTGAVSGLGSAGLTAGTVAPLATAAPGASAASIAPIASAAPAATITGSGAALGGGTLATGAVAPLSVAAPGASAASIAPIAGGSAAAPAITGGASTIGGLTTGQWIKGGNAALQGYGALEAAKEQNKVAEDAAKGKVSTRTPYANEYMRQMLNWIFQEAMARYVGRQSRAGITPTNSSAAMAALSAIPSSYTGVGR